jgi:hypothetical protein
MLTEETAKKYFGNEDPINKVLRANNQFDVKVTGVYKAFPSNAHMHPNILVSFNTLKDSAVYGEEGLRTNWGNNSFFTYLLLPKNYNIETMKARFPAFWISIWKVSMAPINLPNSQRLICKSLLIFIFIHIQIMKQSQTAI